MDGNEYFTAFDGETGKTIDTIYYPIPRLDYESWGDTNGNRCDRYVASVAGLTVSVLMRFTGEVTTWAETADSVTAHAVSALKNGVLNP